MAVREVARSTGIIPTLKRKIATAAANARMSEGTLTELNTGRSTEAPSQRTGACYANSTCSANHTARFRITPTTAAVIAANAAASALLARNTSTKGAPKKIQRKQGTTPTQDVR